MVTLPVPCVYATHVPASLGNLHAAFACSRWFSAAVQATQLYFGRSEIKNGRSAF